MMVDTRLIVAECRAGDLLVALQDAVDGAPHWRLHAAKLLRAISDHELPDLSIEALREADARKRAAEVMDDICRSDASVY
jgi:hypothetical protein